MSFGMSALSPVVLVVEDEPLVLWDIADELRSRGCKVHEARTADQAIVLLEAHKDITILFTDINMPGSMDGIRLAHAVRDRWPPVKIIVTSSRHDVEQMHLPEGSEFMPKPYRPDIVHRSVLRLMG